VGLSALGWGGGCGLICRRLEWEVRVVYQACKQGSEESLVSVLRASVSAGEYGPLITLSGEADVTTAAELGELMAAQLADGTRYLAIDAAGLAFADSASIHVLLTTARTLKERGGGLLLMRPQRPVATVLHLTGASELIIIREETGAEPRP